MAGCHPAGPCPRLHVSEILWGARGPAVAAPGQREIDVYLSGTMLHPYHPDKARLLINCLKFRPAGQGLNGFKSAPEYYDELSRSKACVTFVRHPTALPTRGWRRWRWAAP